MFWWSLKIKKIDAFIQFNQHQNMIMVNNQPSIGSMRSIHPTSQSQSSGSSNHPTAWMKRLRKQFNQKFMNHFCCRYVVLFLFNITQHNIFFFEDITRYPSIEDDQWWWSHLICAFDSLLHYFIWDDLNLLVASLMCADSSQTFDWLIELSSSYRETEEPHNLFFDPV